MKLQEIQKMIRREISNILEADDDMITYTDDKGKKRKIKRSSALGYQKDHPAYKAAIKGREKPQGKGSGKPQDKGSGKKGVNIFDKPAAATKKSGPSYINQPLQTGSAKSLEGQAMNDLVHYMNRLPHATAEEKSATIINRAAKYAEKHLSNYDEIHVVRADATSFVLMDRELGDVMAKINLDPKNIGQATVSYPFGRSSGSQHNAKVWKTIKPGKTTMGDLMDKLSSLEESKSSTTRQTQVNRDAYKQFHETEKFDWKRNSENDKQESLMKKQELQKIIREEIQKVLSEGVLKKSSDLKKLVQQHDRILIQTKGTSTPAYMCSKAGYKKHGLRTDKEYDYVLLSNRIDKRLEKVPLKNIVAILDYETRKRIQ